MIIQVFLLDRWRLNWKVLTVVSFFGVREFQSQLNKILSIIIPLCVFFEILQVMEVDVMKVHFKLVKLMLKLV